MPKRILTLSNRTRTLISRNDILASAGYSVSSPRTPEDALELLRGDHFGAVVCGHSVEKPRRDELFRNIRASFPTVPLVFAYNAPLEEHGDSLADISVDVSDPTNLVRALDELSTVRGTIVFPNTPKNPLNSTYEQAAEVRKARRSLREQAMALRNEALLRCEEIADTIRNHKANGKRL